MAPLRQLGQPFGAPSRIFNIPAPLGAAQGAFANQQALQSATDTLTNALLQKQQLGLQQQDVLAFQQFNQQQQQLGQAESGLALARQDPSAVPQGQLPPGLERGFPAFVPQPQPQSRLFQGLAAQSLAQQQFGDPFGVQRATAENLRARTRAEAVGPPQAGKPTIAKQGDGTGLSPGTVFQADPKGNIKIISEGGGEGLDKGQLTNLAVTQAKEFRADPRIKNFQIIERSERGMQAALKQATSPNAKSRIASDQALGVLFQKMLDPTSVVRESEFARTPEGAALTNRLQAVVPQLIKGGLKLLDEDRQALVSMAQKLLDEAKISANTAFDEFEIRADEIGLNKRVVFGGAKRFDVFSQEEIEAELKRRGAR